MEKQKCNLCRKEKPLKEFRVRNTSKKKKNKICRYCEHQRDSKLWL